MATKTPKDDGSYLDQKVENVSVLDLKVYPGNPRVGDKEAIAASLETNGQFAPIVVQRSTNYVLAGNHTFMAARDLLKWSEIKAVYVDVEDEQAKRIVAASNRTADLGTYNEILLADLLQDIADSETGLEGTGYDDAYLDDLISRVGPEEDEEIETEEGPSGAHFAETEEEAEQRSQQIASRQALQVQGLAEIIVVMSVDEKTDLINKLEALREHLGDKPNGPIIHQAVTMATIICDAAHTNAPPVEWKSIIEQAALATAPIEDGDEG